MSFHYAVRRNKSLRTNHVKAKDRGWTVKLVFVFACSKAQNLKGIYNNETTKNGLISRPNKKKKKTKKSVAQ